MPSNTKMSRKRDLPLNEPSTSCFSLADTSRASPLHKRTCFEHDRKMEVANIRAVGACFRCRLMRISCSGARPCKACLDAAASRHATANLWMRCVPSVLGGLTIFFQGDVPVSESALKSILSKNNHLTANPVHLEFESQVEWSIFALSNELASWMCQKNRTTRMSIVGILSSFRFQQLLSPGIPHSLCIHFQLLMYTSSIVYSHGFQDSYCSYSQEEFNTIRLSTGTKVLKGLEFLLKPAELEKASSEKRRAIFLMLFGTVLAVSYHQQSDGDVQRMSKREFSQLQEQLISVLAHRFVDLVERLALIPGNDNVFKRALVESAKNQWDMPQSFVWKESTAPIKGKRGMAGKLPMNAWDLYDNDSLPTVQECVPAISAEIYDPTLAYHMSTPEEFGVRFCRRCRNPLTPGAWIECYPCSCLSNELIHDPFVLILNEPLPEVSVPPSFNEFTSSSSLSLSDGTFILDYEDGPSGQVAPFEAWDVLSGNVDAYMSDWNPLRESASHANRKGYIV